MKTYLSNNIRFALLAGLALLAIGVLAFRPTVSFATAYTGTGGISSPSYTSTGGITGSGSNSLNPIKYDTLEALMYGIIKDVLIPIGTILVVVYLIYAGFLLVSARGDEKQITQGRTALWNAIIGAVILLGAQAIALMIESTVKSIIGG